jgi:hypothetical protein
MVQGREGRHQAGGLTLINMGSVEDGGWCKGGDLLCCRYAKDIREPSGRKPVS